MKQAETSSRKERLFFVEMLQGLRTGTPDLADTWSRNQARVLPSSMDCVLAAESCLAGHFGIAVAIVGRLGVEGAGAAKQLGLPHPSIIRACSLFSLGQLEGAQVAATDPTIDYEHPMHNLVRAYSEYAKGNLDAAMHLLDAGQAMVGRTLEVDILRLQCLIEVGRYRDAFGIIQSIVPGTPIADVARWWSQDGSRDAPTEMESPTAQWAAFLGPATEHVVALVTEDSRVFTVIDAASWETGFAFAKDLRPSARPVFLRIRPPIRTIHRIRTAISSKK
jgi:hypothetical protein